MNVQQWAKLILFSVAVFLIGCIAFDLYSCTRQIHQNHKLATAASETKADAKSEVAQAKQKSVAVSKLADQVAANIHQQADHPAVQDGNGDLSDSDGVYAAWRDGIERMRRDPSGSKPNVSQPDLQAPGASSGKETDPGPKGS